MKIENGAVVFSTGKTASANGGIIGLSPDSREVFEGYDGTFLYDADSRLGEDEGVLVLNTAEKLELADYMIRLWTDWRAMNLIRFA